MRAAGFFGAGDRTRTGTLSPAVDFESTTSTIPSHRQVRCSIIIDYDQTDCKIFFGYPTCKSFVNPQRKTTKRRGVVVDYIIEKWGAYALRRKGDGSMKKKCNRWLVLLVTMLLPLVLGGCMMTASVEELYSLPQLPVEYQALSAQIDAILASGAEYTSPTSGTNLQSVQLVDLDGDGVEEAVAFFRNSGDERPMKIYIFRALNDVYEQVAVIEGSGTSIYSVSYLDMNRDGVKEILVRRAKELYG